MNRKIMEMLGAGWSARNIADHLEIDIADVIVAVKDQAVSVDTDWDDILDCFHSVTHED